MSAPLTDSQKRYLAQLARAAFWRCTKDDVRCTSGQASDPARTSKIVNRTSAAETDWRHEQVALACGKFGLRCCSQDDYGAVKAHFLHILKRDGAALKALVNGSAEANQRRQALWHLDKAMTALGVGRAYAEGTARRMFHGTTLDNLGTNQIWSVTKALRARASQLKRKGAEAISQLPPPAALRSSAWFERPVNDLQTIGRNVKIILA